LKILHKEELRHVIQRQSERKGREGKGTEAKGSEGKRREAKGRELLRQTLNKASLAFINNRIVIADEA
jgi:hypothetical protein